MYGPPAPRDPASHNKLLVGKVTTLNGTQVPLKRPPGKGDDNDLPREPRSADPLHDRAALIGDPRNDENLIVAQLHLAFLRAHNAWSTRAGASRRRGGCCAGTTSTSCSTTSSSGSPTRRSSTASSPATGSTTP